MSKTRQCKTLHGVDTRVPEKEFQSMLCISVSHHFYTGVAGGSRPPTAAENRCIPIRGRVEVIAQRALRAQRNDPFRGKEAVLNSLLALQRAGQQLTDISNIVNGLDVKNEQEDFLHE